MMNTNMIQTTTAMVLMAAMLTLNFANLAFAASAGARDSAFDVDGFAITSVGGGDDGRDAAIQADGKIVVVGQSNTGAGGAAFDFGIVRYNADGSLDTTFSTDGKATTDFGGIDLASSVAIQTDGKIVVVGETDPVGTPTADFAIARYNTNGTLDTTFDTDGKVTTDFATFNDVANGVVIQTDGKIVAVGVARPTATNGDFAAVRYNTNGALDTTFDTDGKVTINSANSDAIAGVALQTDQKLVMVGSSNASFKVIRLNTNGSQDGAITTTDIPGTGNEGATSAAIQTDGKIVVSGFGVGAVIVRYNTNLTLDTTFDTDGITDIDVNPTVSSEPASDIKLQPDGKIVSAISLTGSNPGFAALRLNSNGSRDTGFGTDGVAIPNVSTFSVSRAIDIQTDGKIILAGDTSGIDFAVARLSPEKHPSASSDFDGDGGADTTVYRPSSGTWFTLRSSDLTVTIEQFGLTGDVPIDGDFDGDGRADLAIFRPSSGVWFFKRSSNGTTLGATFGTATDKPVVGDYDKDGKTDIAIFRPSTGENFIVRSSSNFTTFFGYPFGQAGDINIMGGAQ